MFNASTRTKDKHHLTQAQNEKAILTDIPSFTPVFQAKMLTRQLERKSLATSKEQWHTWESKIGLVWRKTCITR